VSEAPGPEEPVAPAGGQRPGRYPRTSSALVGSLLVTVLAVVAFVALRAVFSKDLEVRPEPVDYLATVTEAQRGGLELVYPADLPAGWIATSVHLDPDADRPAWGLGMLTDDGRFVGLRQEDAPLDDLLHTYVDEEPAEGPRASVSGSVAPTWQTFSDSGGDHAFAAEVKGQEVLVFGSVGTADLRTLLGELTTRRR
jgi:uncharacterized protein DUF4245